MYCIAALLQLGAHLQHTALAPVRIVVLLQFNTMYESLRGCGSTFVPIPAAYKSCIVHCCHFLPLMSSLCCLSHYKQRHRLIGVKWSRAIIDVQ